MKSQIPDMKKSNSITKVSSEYILFPNSFNDGQTNAGVLNETAAVIISLINGNRTVEQIAEEFTKEYDISMDNAVEVVYQFVMLLVEGGVCFWKE